MKKWYASKTFWFNILGLIVMVASAFGYSGDIPPEFAEIGTLAILLINIILRLFFTNEKLTV